MSAMEVRMLTNGSGLAESWRKLLEGMEAKTNAKAEAEVEVLVKE